MGKLRAEFYSTYDYQAIAEEQRTPGPIKGRGRRLPALLASSRGGTARTAGARVNAAHLLVKGAGGQPSLGFKEREGAPPTVWAPLPDVPAATRLSPVLDQV